MSGLLKKANEYLSLVKKIGNLTLLEAAQQAQVKAQQSAAKARKLHERYLQSIKEDE